MLQNISLVFGTVVKNVLEIFCWDKGGYASCVERLVDDAPVGPSPAIESRSYSWPSRSQQLEAAALRIQAFVAQAFVP